MEKHYSPPQLLIVELRLRDVIMQSDEWEGPILFGMAPDDSMSKSNYSIYDEDLPEE